MAGLHWEMLWLGCFISKAGWCSVEMFVLSSGQSSLPLTASKTSPPPPALATTSWLSTLPVVLDFPQHASSLLVCERGAMGFSGLSRTWMIVRLHGQSSKMTRKSIRGPGKLGTSLTFTWDPCGCKRPPQSPQWYSQNLRRLKGEKQTSLPRSSDFPLQILFFYFWNKSSTNGDRYINRDVK